VGPKTTKLYGPPGTGKTTECIRAVEKLIAGGAAPEKIGYFSFTQKAANVARERACEYFGLPASSFPNFRTIHSLAYHQLGMNRGQVMDHRQWKEFGELAGYEFQGRTQIEDGSLYGMNRGDRIRFLEGLSRNRRTSLESAYLSSQDFDDVAVQELEVFSLSLQKFKRNRGLIDFGDILENFIAAPDHCVPELDAVICDEAQDNSLPQWDIIRRLAEKTNSLLIAGDDDQATYSWAGADVESFLSFPGEVRVLHKSMRVPRAVQPFSERIVSRIVRRAPKAWGAREGDSGRVSWERSVDNIDMSTGKWMILARNGYMLSKLEKRCMEDGYAFTSVGRSPIDSPALKAIMIWEGLRKNAEFPKREIEKLYRYCSPAVLPDRAGLSAAAADQPLAGQEARGWFGFGGQMPVWHEALDLIDPTEREYFIAARRRGEKLLDPKPRIEISTIHAAKGGEAENVVLLTDVSTRSQRQMTLDPDSEHRVFYVATTRAAKNLFLVEPQTPIHYEV
jgi:DNA helicase-2/ATP-dependent DNA helicase PcrA